MNTRDTHFVVEPPLSYETTPDPVDGPTPVGNKRAVIVVHGMGQQTTFGTVASLVSMLSDEPEACGVARSVQIGDQRLSRLEMSVRNEEGHAQDVHLYEAYWAPLTEGRVSLRDVTRFLMRAGVGGLRASFRKDFPRWAFGAMRRYAVNRSTPFALSGVLILLIALAVINTIVLGAAGSSMLGRTQSWPDPALLAQLNSASGLVALVLLTLFATLIGASRLRTRPVGPRLTQVFSGGGWFHTAGAGLTIAGMASVMAAAVMNRRIPFFSALVEVLSANQETMLILCSGTVAMIVLILAARVGFAVRVCTYLSIAWTITAVVVVIAIVSGHPLFSPGFELPSGLVWGWWFVIGATLMVRQVLIQYLGDVAAYISPQTLDKFNELREEIKACVLKVGSSVYSASRNGMFLYDQITVVGHSLGSVAAYDMLNRLLRDDAASDGRCDIEGRTRGLITFGSPLDKTAFLFGMQHVNEAAHALAATVQPMLQAGVRNFDWINIHSAHDIVSGPLQYFDDGSGNGGVTNLVDPAATTPLVAHVEYWTNPVLRCELRKLVTTTRRPGPRISIKNQAPTWSPSGPLVHDRRAALAGRDRPEASGGR